MRWRSGEGSSPRASHRTWETAAYPMWTISSSCGVGTQVGPPGASESSCDLRQEEGQCHSLDRFPAQDAQ
eukprot:7408964-Prorocentrum_lima.AAC.1